MKGAYLKLHEAQTSIRWRQHNEELYMLSNIPNPDSRMFRMSKVVIYPTQ